MSVWDFCLWHRRKIAQSLQSGFLHNITIKRIHCIGNPIQNHTAQRVFGKITKPRKHSCQRKRLSLRTHNQYRRRTCFTRQMRGGGRVGRAGNAIIEAHYAFDYADTVLRNAAHNLTAYFTLTDEKKVKISAWNAEDCLVKHGIDIIRSALECCKRNISSMHRAQNSKRDRCFSAAAARSGNHDPRCIIRHI